MASESLSVIVAAGFLRAKVCAESTKLTATWALCSSAVEVRVTAPPPAAAVGPSSTSVVAALSAVRATVTVWSASAMPSVPLSGMAMVMPPLVWPAAMVKLPLPASVGA